jgi:hypothetical protein
VLFGAVLQKQQASSSPLKEAVDKVRSVVLNVTGFAVSSCLPISAAPPSGQHLLNTAAKHMLYSVALSAHGQHYIQCLLAAGFCTC